MTSTGLILPGWVERHLNILSIPSQFLGVVWTKPGLLLFLWGKKETGSEALP